MFGLVCRIQTTLLWTQIGVCLLYVYWKLRLVKVGHIVQ